MEGEDFLICMPPLEVGEDWAGSFGYFLYYFGHCWGFFLLLFLWFFWLLGLTAAVLGPLSLLNAFDHVPDGSRDDLKLGEASVVGG